ncbi:sulfatase-like hydrolase/transferase [Paenibacillus sp. P25]|nr:sulfatase-like hydrolase/transferase [Paenibacillus sp. P25]
MVRTKPEIIFLMTDQRRWDCIGRYNEHIITPTIDKLAEEGIIYNQAVCQAPMCVPSRGSMMFGYYPSQLGVRTNYGGLYEEDRSPSDPVAGTDAEGRIPDRRLRQDALEPRREESRSADARVRGAGRRACAGQRALRGRCPDDGR